jgi:hypothetical protein
MVCPVGVLAAWFVVVVQPVSISTAMPSVALGFAFTWPILVDGYVEPGPGLDQVRFLEDHGPGRQGRWRDDFLNGENGLDQFRGARPRLKSLQQPRPDPGPPNQMVSDLLQPGVVAAGNDPHAVEVQFLELPEQLIRQPARLNQHGATALLVESLGFAYLVICRSEWSDHAVPLLAFIVQQWAQLTLQKPAIISCHYLR